MKILLATDGSDNARRAIEVVSRLKWAAPPTVLLVHVTHPIPEPEVPFPTVFSEEDLVMMGRVEKEHEVRAAERLEAGRGALPKDWDVVPVHRVGGPAREILAVIEAERPDLAVLGATGLDEVPVGGMGGVAHKVARYAPCPVLLVRGEATVFRRALVALDDAPHAAGTTAYLKDARWLEGCALTLCHVVEDRYLRESRIAASQFAGSERYLDRLQQVLIAEGQKVVDRHAAAFQGTGWRVDTLVLEGDPAGAVVARAEGGGHDLVVVGARGRHGLGRFLLGSTSQQVMRHAAASVLVVRGGAWG